MRSAALRPSHSKEPSGANRCTFAGEPVVWERTPARESRHVNSPASSASALPRSPARCRQPQDRHVRHPARTPHGRARHRVAVAGHADRRRQGHLSRQRAHRHRPAHRRRPARAVRGVPAGRSDAAAVCAAGAGLHRHPRHRHHHLGAAAGGGGHGLVAQAAEAGDPPPGLRRGAGHAAVRRTAADAGAQPARLHHADRRRHADAPPAGAGAAGAQPAGAW